MNLLDSSRFFFKLQTGKDLMLMYEKNDFLHLFYYSLDGRNKTKQA